MKLYLKTKNVLDERETQEMYRIEHRGMWGMYALLCAAVVVQMLFGAGFAQVAGEAFVIAVVSIGMIIAYARRGIWDADARPSTGGNAAYALLCALGVTAVTFGLHENAVKAAFILCFALLSLLMAYVKKRQKQQSDELDDK